MKRYSKLTSVILFSILALQSCFKDEPLNAECDIEQAYIHADTPEEMFFNLTDTLVNVPYDASLITFSVRRHADLTALALHFRLTEGATIVPENGSVQDFSAGPVSYTVTSEDGLWSRTYLVSVNKVSTITETEIAIDFENFELDPDSKKYYIWHNVLGDGSLGNDWATGNPGFRLSMSSAKADQYPTTPLEEGLDGAALKLETKDTGPFGRMANIRLAAGNMFLGTFNLANALKEPLNATRFGIPFDKKPVKLTGYYQYQPGEKYQDKEGKAVEGKTDIGNIYAVLYRNHDSEGNAIVLHGDDVKTNSNIVALADLEITTATDEWTPFEFEFNYLSDIDMDLLENRGYNITVVFSSSRDGAFFEGAIGSCLKVDKVRLICEEEE
mgnify:CR=1 FL=1